MGNKIRAEDWPSLVGSSLSVDQSERVGSRVMHNADGVEPNNGLNIESDLLNRFISSLGITLV